MLVACRVGDCAFLDLQTVVVSGVVEGVECCVVVLYRVYCRDLQKGHKGHPCHFALEAFKDCGQYIDFNRYLKKSKTYNSHLVFYLSQLQKNVVKPVDHK